MRTTLLQWSFLFLLSPSIAWSLPHIVFIAGSQSHGYGEHEFNAGGEILVRDLNASGLVRATLYRDGWPESGVDEDADAIVLYMDGDSGHAVNAHLEEVDALVNRGVGIAALHFAVHATEPVGEKYFKRWLGGYYHSQTSTNPHWQGHFAADSDHDIFNGVNDFSARDEFYFNILFTPEAKPILLATPPDEARDHVPHPRRTLFFFGGSVPEEVASNPGREETIAWGVERADGGRGFGFTGGHFHWNWGSDNYRKFVLNALLWSAGAEVPERGVPVIPLSFESLRAGQDEQPGWRFDEAAVRRTFGFPVQSVLAPELFEVEDGLRVDLWAASPLLYNPTNIDVDAQGRVWATEGWNYRDMPGHREAGDRVVVVYDSNGDGRADKSHTFVQDPELKSPLGIAVVGNKVLVSQPPNLIEYTDVDGDLRFDAAIDNKRNLLSGFNGYDHDHSLHAVTVGPDGWLYANTGNMGGEVLSADQQPFFFGSHYRNPEFQPRASADGHVYVSGAAFRFRPDGTGLEVIGHNFRNSYEQVITSFGDVYNNDNDDTTGSRTTRVLEGGNLGYTSDDGLETWYAGLRPGQEAHLAHWRQYDPDVQPAGDIYGDGAPTGIVVVEGDELGQQYRGTLLSAEAALNKILAYRVGEHTPRGVLPEYQNWLTSNPEAEYSGIDTGFVGGEQDGFSNVIKGQLRDAVAGRGLESWFPWLYESLAAKTLFRPSDIAIGPEGAVYVSDWFDPRVGGHTAYDAGRQGAIYRVSNAASTHASAHIDFDTIEGLVDALKSPAVNVRGHAFHRLSAHGEVAFDALVPLFDAENRFYRARAVWLLPYMGARGAARLQKLLQSTDAQMRVLALRVKHRHGVLNAQDKLMLSTDSSAAVRQELALTLRNDTWEDCATALVNIANRYPVGDRHYLYALGAGATGKARALYATLRKEWSAPEKWTQAEKDIAWRLHVPEAVDDALRLAQSARGDAWKQALDTIGFGGGENAMAALASIAAADLSEEHAEYLVWWQERLSKSVTAETPETQRSALPTLDPNVVAKLQGDAERGEQLYWEQPCATCHAVAGKGGNIGPAIELVLEKSARPALVKNMIEPISPLMPPAAQLGLLPQDIADIATYLEGLR